MNRTGFLAASASLVAAGTAPAQALGVPGGTHLVERKADFDARAWNAAVGRPAKIRQLWDAVAFKPVIWGNVKNAMNGLQFGFGYAPDEIAVAWCGHGPSAAYVYSDYIWSKYRIGAFFGIHGADGAILEKNVFYPAKSSYDRTADPDDERGMYQDTSLAMLQRRGMVVNACHTAVEEQSRALVAKKFAPAGMTADDVAADILTHLVPGAMVVPSMVAAITVLQHVYHYTYTTFA